VIDAIAPDDHRSPAEGPEARPHRHGQAIISASSREKPESESRRTRDRIAMRLQARSCERRS
jgi:hypothetical protein